MTLRGQPFLPLIDLKAQASVDVDMGMGDDEDGEKGPCHFFDLGALCAAFSQLKPPGGLQLLYKDASQDTVVSVDAGQMTFCTYRDAQHSYAGFN